MSDHSIRTVTVKLYPNASQAEKLTTFLAECCRIHNRGLEHRIKAYKRRGEHVAYNMQSSMLTQWRRRIPSVRAVPVVFARSALKRIDRAFAAFFRRCKSGEKRNGFPRFKSRHRYNSMEYSEARFYHRGRVVHVPGIGEVVCRGQQVLDKQKLLRIVRRASGWYAQLVMAGHVIPLKVTPQSAVGIDVGLTAFAALSDGSRIENPRFARKAERKLRALQRGVSRRKKGSRNRRKAVNRLARIYERVAAQRKDFAHQESRKLVNRFDLIGFEKLNIKGLARTRLAKSIMDAAWGMFLFFVTYKAESAGRHAIAVDPRGTSQECPQCGAIKKKSLNERVHQCSCAPLIVIDRDEAAAKVILAHALGIAGAERLGRPPPLPRRIRGKASGADETGSLFTVTK